MQTAQTQEVTIERQITLHKNSERPYAWSNVKALMEKYANLLGVDIEIHTVAHAISPEKEPGKLHIKAYSVPFDTDYQSYDKVLSFDMDGNQEDGFKPTGEGIPILDFINGQSIAEIHDGTLYILFDIFADQDSSPVIEYIMEDYATKMLPAKTAASKKPTPANDVSIHVGRMPCGHWSEIMLRLRKKLMHHDTKFAATLYFFDELQESIGYLPSDSRLHIFISNSGKIDIGVPIDEMDNAKSKFSSYLLPNQMFMFLPYMAKCPDESSYFEERLFESLDYFISKVVIPKSQYKRLVQSRETLFNERIARERKTSLENWQNLLSKQIDGKIKQAEEKLVESHKQIQDLSKRLIAATRTKDEALGEVGHYKYRADSMKAAFGAEYEKLFEVPHVFRVVANNSTIEVFTDNIIIDHEGDQYDIGQFKIIIDPDAQSYAVRMFNLTRKVKGVQDNMQHPHVFEDGHPCFGNIDAAITEYIASYEFATVVILCIEYLLTVNVNDDAGMYIGNWPKVRTSKK